MQRTFVAITLALAFSCALAVFTPTNYVKNPVVVVYDNETNYTNITGALSLNSLVAGELDLVGTTTTLNLQNSSNNGFALVYRKLDSKVLTSKANSTLAFNGSLNVVYANGYAISVNTDNDTTTNNTPQVTINQYPVTGGNGVSRFTVSNNSKSDWSPKGSVFVLAKTAYVFFNVYNTTTNTSTQVNITSFTVGTTTKGSLLTTLSYDLTGDLSITWGEALGSNQLYANWQEGPADARVLKYSTIDVSKGTVNATTVASWVNTSECQAFSTDKKWYGDLCTFTNKTDAGETINFYIRYNSSTIVPFNSNANVTLFTNTSTLNGVYSYGPYLAVFYVDTVTNANAKTYSYELWNLDTLTTNKNKTTFLVTDLTTKNSFFKVQSAGLYSLSYNQAVANSTVNTYSSIQVGQVLSGSYLTSVLGFIMTIVAGVLLF